MSQVKEDFLYSFLEQISWETGRLLVPGSESAPDADGSTDQKDRAPGYGRPPVFLVGVNLLRDRQALVSRSRIFTSCRWRGRLGELCTGYHRPTWRQSF